MKVIISEQHLKRYPELAKYALKKVEKLSRYNSAILSITIHIISEKAHRGQDTDYQCELIVKIPGRDLTIHDSERALDKAVDKAVERAKNVIIKQKEKEISKKHKAGIRSKL